MTPEEREGIYGEVHRLVAPYARESDLPSGMCLYWAAYGVLALQRRGLRAILAAGSAGWPMISAEQDDGARPSHFSYMWDPRAPALATTFAAGWLPEMHVWIRLPSPEPAGRVIVDFASGFFPAQARRICRYDWPGTRPPKFLWCRQDRLPRGAFYKPDETATVLAVMAVRSVLGKEAAAAMIRDWQQPSLTPAAKPGLTNMV